MLGWSREVLAAGVVSIGRWDTIPDCTFPARGGGLGPATGTKQMETRSVSCGEPRWSQASFSWAAHDLGCIAWESVSSPQGPELCLSGVPPTRHLAKSLTAGGNDDVFTHLKWGHCWKESTLYTGSRCPSSKLTGGKIQCPALIAQGG